jgi:predicted lipoprotein with Yx(FWY)xxD motif
MSKPVAPVAVTLVVVTALLTFVAQAALAARADTMKPQLVKTIMDKQLGEVLVTSKKQAIYVWNSEPKGKIRCTGTCAKQWPPVIVKKGVVVPMHVEGIMGDFGTIKRANGVRQLTFNRRALYTYAHEKPGQVLCNDVDNWFAVKVHM